MPAMPVRRSPGSKGTLSKSAFTPWCPLGTGEVWGFPGSPKVPVGALDLLKSAFTPWCPLGTGE